MRRIIVPLLIVVLIVSWTGCSSSGAPQKRVPSKTEEDSARKADPAANPPKAQEEPLPNPWPDRIEVKVARKIEVNTYLIEGETVNVGADNKEIREKISMVIKNVGGKWTVSEFKTGEKKEKSVVYKNTEFGFTFNLPPSWQGYTIVKERWESNDKGQSGPIISIRHPKWTKEVPRQDIPIMLFTPQQWKLVEEEKLVVGAAPIGPRKLGENKEFVFALPARYNFSFLEGFEEVDKIMESNPLKAFD